MSQQAHKHAEDEQTNDENDGPDWKVVAAGGGIGLAIVSPESVDSTSIASAPFSPLQVPGELRAAAA